MCSWPWLLVLFDPLSLSGNNMYHQMAYPKPDRLPTAFTWRVFIWCPEQYEIISMGHCMVKRLVYVKVYGLCLLRGTNCLYTGCHRRNGPNFGRVFLMLNYTDITQNTYVQSWTVSEIMASKIWNFDSCYTLTDYQIHNETGRNM